MKIIIKDNPKRKALECLSHGGRTPVTRRSFLQGSMAGAASYVLAPTVLNLLTQKAYAEECNLGAPALSGNRGAVIEYHAAGGAAWAEDFFLTDRGGQALTGDGAYENFGHSNESGFNSGILPNTVLGVPMHPQSPLLQGLLRGLGATANTAAEMERIKSLTDSIDGFIVAATSDSDSADNAFSPAHYFPRLGRLGGIAADIGNTATGKTGGRHQPVIGSYRSDFAPRIVTSTTAARGLAGQGRIFERIGADKAKAALQTAAKMSEAKLKSFKKLSFEEQIKASVGCDFKQTVGYPDRYEANTLFPEGAALTADPISTAFPSGTFSVPASSAGEITPFLTAQTFTFNNNNTSSPALISRLTLGDVAAVGVVNIGGYDNHNGTSLDPSRQRFSGGYRMGCMLRYASLVGKPLTIIALTDGGMGVTRQNNIVVTDNNTGRIQRPGDSDATALAFCLTYKPGAKRGDLVRASMRQVGAFTRAGVENYLRSARDTNIAAQVFVYNWLALHGAESEIASIMRTIESNPFSNADADKYLIFKKT